MSNSKNYYGENVAWFCTDVAITLDDMQEDGMLLSSVDVYGEDESGREGCCEVDVVKLLESASVVIYEQHSKIDELSKQRSDLVKTQAIMNFVNNMIGAFESGFIEDNQSNLADIYQCAKVHIKDNYGIDIPNLEHEWGKELALQCKESSNSLLESASVVINEKDDRIKERDEILNDAIDNILSSPSFDGELMKRIAEEAKSDVQKLNSKEVRHD